VQTERAQTLLGTFGGQSLRAGDERTLEPSSQGIKPKRVGLPKRDDTGSADVHLTDVTPHVPGG